MARDYFDLSEADRLLFLQSEELRLGLDSSMVEKDIWTVWFLKYLFTVMRGTGLVFHGGTCLSKAHKLIFRMSEDIDLYVSTLQTSRGRPTDRSGLFPTSPSQATQWKNDAKQAIKELYRRIVSSFDDYLGATGTNARIFARSDNTSQTFTFFVDFNPLLQVPIGMLPELKIEINGSGAGIPNSEHYVECYSEGNNSGILLPNTKVLAQSPEAIFWSKVIAIMGFCYGVHGVYVRPRDLYDIHYIDASKYGSSARKNLRLGMEMAQSRDIFYPVPGFSNLEHVKGKIILKPPPSREAEMRTAYNNFLATGMIFKDALPYDTALETASRLQDQLNRLSA